MDNKTLKTLAVTALVVAVGGLTLGYASLTQVLNINTTASVQNASASWNVHFDKTADKTVGTQTGDAVKGSASVEDHTVTISNVVLKAPGDTISWSFDVVNEGNIDAQIKTWVPKTVTFTSNSTDSTVKAADEKLVKDNLVCNWTLDGAAVGSQPLNNGGGHATLKLSCSLKSDMDDLPAGTVTISNLGATLTYEQKNK